LGTHRRPHYGNEIATLRLEGRTASLVIEKAGRDAADDPALTQGVDLNLS
jgi:hypothetical protein